MKLAMQKYGCSPVAHLRDLGFLDSKTTCAHSIHYSPQDMDIVSKTKSTIVHNPLSNLRLGSGICPLLAFKNKSVNVAFGCDGSASNDSQDMLEAIKIGCQLHNSGEKDYRKWLEPWEALKAASDGGAKGLGQGQIQGSISVGKRADLLLVSPKSSLSLLPVSSDPARHLVFSRPSLHEIVKAVWVSGKLVVSSSSFLSSSSGSSNLVGLPPPFLSSQDVEKLRDAIVGHSVAWRFTENPSYPPSTIASPTRKLLEDRYRKSLGLEP